MAATIDASTEHNITLYQGETFRRQPFLTWRTGAPLVLIDLTGFTARLQVRTRWGDTNTALITLTESSGLTLNGAAGTMDLEITAAQAETLVKQRVQHVYDLRLVAPGPGDIVFLVYGLITVLPRVTAAA